MRKIIIPQEAIDRHDEKLGKAIQGYLDHLAEGGVVVYKLPQKSRLVYSAQDTEHEYWEWVRDEFRFKKVLSATPVLLVEFAQRNANWLAKIGGQRRIVIHDLCTALFNYDALREGMVLSAARPNDNIVTIIWSAGKKEKQKWKDGTGTVWGLEEFTRLLGVRYCPYCNAETVGMVLRTNPKAKTLVAYSALDHIIPKGKYPLLALSLYNLVPACTKCNSQLKHENDDLDLGHWNPRKPFNALHPYAHNIHKWFRFVYRPSSVDALFLDSRKSRQAPLSIARCIPLPKKCRPGEKLFYK